MSAEDIGLLNLAGAYVLLLAPLGLLLWYRAPMLRQTAVALVRMTVQLLFVGLYLQVVFKWNNTWLTGLWLVVMIGVADTSIISGCGLRLRPFAFPLFVALLTGTTLPLALFLGPILEQPQGLDAQYAIPIGGMILGNCLRADIVGIKSFYGSLRTNDRPFLHALAQGATLTEATRPYARDAFQAALAPTVATMATIGLVALPGMMTGVILGGADPMTAIKYQIAIMIAIFSGTAITVALAIGLTMRNSFTPHGILDRRIFKK